MSNLHSLFVSMLKIDYFGEQSYIENYLNCFIKTKDITKFRMVFGVFGPNAKTAIGNRFGITRITIDTLSDFYIKAPINIKFAQRIASYILESYKEANG